MMTTVTAVLLGSANLISAVGPADVLPDNEDVKVFANGVKIRKGTIGATFVNAKIFEGMSEGGYTEKDLETLRSEQISFIPALEQIGLFAFFGAEDMLSAGPGREGTAWIALLYFSINPDKLTTRAAQKIADLERNSSALLSSEIKILFGGFAENIGFPLE